MLRETEQTLKEVIEAEKAAEPEKVTPGIDTQSGVSAVGLLKSPKFSADKLQVTALPRNLEVKLYKDADVDVGLFKEPGGQFQVQTQPKDTGRGWETHTTLGAIVDVLNVSLTRAEFAITTGGGYDLKGRNVAVTGSIGFKYTLVENLKIPIVGPFGTNKLRLFAGVGAEGDIATAPGAPSGFGGVAAGGGLLFEGNPIEKKK